MGGRTFIRSLLSLFVLTIVFTVLCSQANAMQYINMPKYDIGISVDPSTAAAGSHVQVTSHVTFIYYQQGKDPSVPGIYVDYELKGPSGESITSSSASGTTDDQGINKADIAVPDKPGDYTIVVRAYDIAGGQVNGQNEAHFTVKAAAPATATAVAGTPTPVLTTPIPPTIKPPTAVPRPGGLHIGTGELLIIGAVILVLLILLLAVIAVIAFLLLRKKKKPEPPKPAAPVALPKPPEPAPSSRFCMHCGASMAMDAAKCPKCGLTPPSGVDTKQCANCGTVIPESAKFCYNCGVAQPKKE